jgi:hypothetical protein
MSALTEAEIFDCLRENLKGAADDCDLIARFPQSGVAFDRMRKRLKLVEGACRQAAFWREDARWLQPGLKMEQAHQIARTWLHRPSVQSKKLFAGLAAALRRMHADIDRLEAMRAPRLGMILPRLQAPTEIRHGRPVQVMTPGGLIVPASYAAPPAAATD